MSDGLLQKEKQRNLLLHQEGEIQRQRTFQGHHAPALQVMESREMNVRKQEMQGSLERFYRRFHKDWYSKTLASSPTGGIMDIQYSLADIKTLTKGRFRSGTAAELRNCMLEANAVASDETLKLDFAQNVNLFFRLAMASQNYCDSHQGRRWTFDGAAKVKLAAKVSRMTRDCLKNLLSEKEMDAIYSDEGVEEVEGQELTTLTEELKRAAKGYKGFLSQMSGACQGYSANELLRRKMEALRLYEKKIKLYRKAVPNFVERDPAIEELIEAYEEGLGWEKLLSYTKEKKNSIGNVIDNHMEAEGEEKREKLSFKEKDEGLSKEQLQGIDAIDNWLVRNCQNGGLLGLFSSGAKNSDHEFVSGILEMSKRERIFIYYLVENKKRRNPTPEDVDKSQSGEYIPDLYAFKNQMLATKWKFWKRLKGSYTYMDKLSDACQAAFEFRNQLLAAGGVLSEQEDAEHTGYYKKQEFKEAWEGKTEGTKADDVMSAAEFAGGVATIISSVVKQTNAAQLATKGLGAGCAMLSTAVAITKSVELKKLDDNGRVARKFFDDKRKKLEERQKLGEKVSSKEKREVRYEKCMKRLQKDLRNRHAKDTAFAWLNAGAMVAELVIPGVSLVCLGFAAVEKIIDCRQVKGLRTRLMDNFFNLDELTDKVLAQKEAERIVKVSDAKDMSRAKLKEALRKRVAARAGFSSLKTAAKAICRKFAKLVRAKLFGGEEVDKAEKEAYKKFVLALGLPYNEEKQLPSENVLARKMCGK